jgi:hypothetical protein
MNHSTIQPLNKKGGDTKIGYSVCSALDRVGSSGADDLNNQQLNYDERIMEMKG